jgi:hypothetical protein
MNYKPNYDHFNSVFTWFMKKRIHQIELFMKYPNEVQEEWFEQLVAGAENTEWGKNTGTKALRTWPSLRSAYLFKITIR